MTWGYLVVLLRREAIFGGGNGRLMARRRECIRDGFLGGAGSTGFQTILKDGAVSSWSLDKGKQRAKINLTRID